LYGVNVPLPLPFDQEDGGLANDDDDVKRVKKTCMGALEILGIVLNCYW